MAVRNSTVRGWLREALNRCAGDKPAEHLAAVRVVQALAAPQGPDSYEISLNCEGYLGQLQKGQVLLIPDSLKKQVLAECPDASHIRLSASGQPRVVDAFDFDRGALDSFRRKKFSGA
jgi:hypothetical protein